ncbi:MAG: hypothetical protein LBI92_01015 [Azoarcus sp.]|jgi:hypothetical protein|nr:hypothetical protein [Azoarcus sp.]
MNIEQGKARKWRRVSHLLIAVAIAIAVPLIYMSWRAFALINGFQPPEMAAAQHTPRDVIGDLGGMKVRIPRHYAEYVEYDSDPGFGEKRKGPRPQRTFDSRLTSFGIDVRFPDMKGLENAQMREDRRRQFLQKDNPWIGIGINAGEIYPGDGFLDRQTERTLFNTDSSKYKGHWLFTYERMPEDEYGLEVWRLSGIDFRTGKPARESSNTNDIYVHRDASGKVDINIWCRRPSAPKGIGTCNAETHLEPKAKVVVKVSFRRSLLPEWQRIRQSVRDLLLSFEVDPASIKVSSSSSSAQVAQ